METKLFKINGHFAHENGVPSYFAGNILKETAKAVYLYGTFTTETTGINTCCVCGRGLTHPVSVVLGIGPECGGHWWDWKAVGGYSIENIKRLMEVVRERMKGIVIDQWFPKRVVLQELPTETIVNVPSDHPMVKPRELPKLAVYSDHPQPKKPGLVIPLIHSNPKKATMFLDKGKYDAIKIVFPYNPADIEKIRTLNHRHFESAGKYWVSSVELENVQKLLDWGFELDEKLQSIIRRSKANTGNLPEIEIPGLRGELFPFQKQGVAFIEAREGNAAVTDEMGLGKTMQALAYLQLHPELRPAIIVVPATVKGNWANKANEWMSNPRVEVLSGTTPHRITGEIIIINYDILSDWVEVLKSIKPKVMVCDECHYFKNSSAQRTKAVKRLGKLIPHNIVLSGTPIVNRPVEFYNAINLVEPTLFTSFIEYVNRYCNPKHNGFGWDYSGASNTEELHRKLVSSIMIRRLKKDVLTDLPDKLKSFIPMELSNHKEYRYAENNFIQFVRERKGAVAAERASNAEALAEIEGLKQLAVRGKLKQAMEWIQDFLEVDGKLVVFAVHKFVVDELMVRFKGLAVKIDGSVPPEHRPDIETRFQNDPSIRLFVGNIQAAGVGLTLTAASNVAFLELPWTPGELVQAEDRCHRIGQKDTVNIHFLLAEGTIEERIARLIDKKKKVLDAVLDGRVTEQESLLSELMNEYDPN